ncbi:MAG: hypothetical protein ACT4OV_10175 [Microthrixaceae bacterium]
MDTNDERTRISDLSMFLIGAAVWGGFGWVRSGPLAGLAFVGVHAAVVLISRFVRARSKR